VVLHFSAVEHPLFFGFVFASLVSPGVVAVVVFFCSSAVSYGFGATLAVVVMVVGLSVLFKCIESGAV